MGNRRSSNSNFMVQGGILAAASIICRLIGIVYRIPLTNIIGDEGNGYYSCAFEVYSIMLLLSSYSLPLAVSKLVSAKSARGQKKNAYKIYKCALVFASIVGLIAALAAYFGSDFLAGTLMSQPMSAIALRILAPAILVVAIMGVLRGYFQGLGTMMPTVFSQVIEQIVNAVVSVAAAYYLYAYGKKLDAFLFTESYAPAYGAAGGTLGTGIGALAGLIFLLFVTFLYKKVIQKQIRKDRSRRTDSYSEIFGILILTIVPVILSTAVYNISSILDQSMFNNVLAAQGIDKREYSSLWGIYSGKCKLLTNVPVAIANALAASTVPALTAAIAEENYRAGARKINYSIRFTMILVIPCAIGFTVLASPILQLLFKDASVLPERLLQMGSVTVILYSLSTLTNGILQGINQMKIPVRNAVISLVLHLAALYVMLTVFKLGIYAVVIANIIFSLLMCVLNGFAIGRHFEYRQEIKYTFVMPLIASLFMGLSVFLIYKLMFLVFNNEFSTIVSIIIGAVIYFIVMLALKAITRDDLERMPGGYTIIGIAEKLRLM